MSLFDFLGRFNRSNFPDLSAAAGAVSLESLITPGEPAAQIAKDEQAKLEGQLATDFCSFTLSLGTATERAGENSCVDKHEHEAIDSQLGQWQATNAPQTVNRQPTKPYKAAKKLPPVRSSAPGGRPARSLTSTRVNFGATSNRPKVHYIPTLSPKPDKAKQEQRATQFIRAQAGQRGTSIGDAAIVFGPTGTPYLGDSYLDRANLYNTSSNLASSTPPVLEPPKAIKPKVIGTGRMNRAAAAQVAPQSNTAGNILALLGIAAGVSAIMFALQYVVQIVSFVFNIQNLLMTCNNIAASFSALFNTIGSLLGLSDDLSKPLNDTINGLLNSVFGKEKVDYVKYQWAKVSAVFSSASNVLNGLRGVSNTLGNAVEIGTNNTGRIGNALRSMGFLDRTVGAFEENVSARTGTGKIAQLNNSLEVANQASSSLSQAAADIKSGREELEAIDKEREEKAQEAAKDKTETDKKYGGEAVPVVPNFKPGDY